MKVGEKLLVRRHWLKEDLRSGFTYGVGFFLVDRNSKIDEKSYFFDGTVVRIIIDKRGKEVPIIRLKPHEHEFRPNGDKHICECGYSEMHRAPCPHRHCIICGAETETQHYYTKLVETKIETEPHYRKIEVYECEGCGQRKEVVVEECLMTKEELELAKRVASTFEPFEQVHEIPRLWHDLAQSYVPLRAFSDLRKLVSEWVIETCKEGEWKTAFFYEVPRDRMLSALAFFGHVQFDSTKVYIKSLTRIPSLTEYEKQVETFVPRDQWWRLYRPVIFTGKNFCVIPTDMNKIAEDVKFFEENAEEVLELLAKHAYLFDKVKEAPSEALQTAKSTDERLHIILSHIAVLEWTRIQMMTAPLPDFDYSWDKWD